MANRSYLYGIDETHGIERRIVGISEWAYDVPLVFKILLSAETALCDSLIWDDAHALMGNFNDGVMRLKDFLSRITLPEAQPLITEALAFLENPQNAAHYFVLETAEIFDMDEAPADDQLQDLLAEIKDIDGSKMDNIAAPTVALLTQTAKPAGFTQKILDYLVSKPQPMPAAVIDPLQEMRDLGLGNWSNILYFDIATNNKN